MEKKYRQGLDGETWSEIGMGKIMQVCWVNSKQMEYLIIIAP